MKGKKHTFMEYIENLQSNGQYWFIRVDTIKALKMTKIAFKMTVGRLKKAKRIKLIGKGFYLIVPVEYRRAGSPPPYWYIDPFMKFLQINYYIGLLSAAAYYGASHQVSQQFQVIVDRSVILGKTNQLNLVFFRKKDLSNTPVEDLKVATGFVKISTKEATALDLVQYYKAAGYFGLIATILLELSPLIDPKLLLLAVKQGQYEIATVQRLGYLLDFLGFKEKTEYLFEWLQEQWRYKKYKKLIVLVPNKLSNIKQHLKDLKWHIIINEKIEVDEV